MIIFTIITDFLKNKQRSSKKSYPIGGEKKLSGT